MHRIIRDHIVYSFCKGNPPALVVAPGDTVLVETWDARTGTVRSSADLLDHPHPLGMNPATGPILVQGAESGDSLVVEILGVDLGDWGFLAVKKGVGLLAHRAEQYATRIIPIREGVAHFSDKVQFPVRPMVGVIGTAPSGDALSTGMVGPHGGNMDNNEVKAGARVHLPVFIDGALLGIGDVHASMGDGEISMVGFETCAEVTVRIDLLKGQTLRRPFIETADGRLVTTGDDLDPTTALRIATEEMVDILMTRRGLSFEDAYMLVTACCDLAVCQACEPGRFPVTTRMSLPGRLAGL